MNRKAYEDNLKKIQEAHLRAVEGAEDANWQPCMHDGCGECHGTGVKRDGTGCVHMISCPCPRCTPRC